MSESSTEKQSPPWVGRVLAALATFAYRRPLVAALVIAMLTAALGSGATRLRINPDLSELLPSRFESVQNLDALRKEFGGIGHLTVVVDSKKPEALRSFADALATRLESLEFVRYVNHKRPIEFFSDRALYYLELEDLQTIQKRFEAREAYEKLNANPLYIALEETEPPSLDMSDIREKYEELRDAGEDEPEAYFIGNEGTRLVLFIKPTQLASDLNFAKELVAAVEGEIAATKPEAFDPQMHVALSGRYKKRIDMQGVVQGDLKIASLLALGLMLAYLGLHFRRASSVVLVFVPLTIGLAWTYGLAGWTLETLNILTAFVGTILLGVGIDVGIHIQDRAEHERHLGGEEAVREAFGHTGHAAAIASLTTVVGFASLTLSDFRVFREFGVLSSSGLLLVLLSYLICLPVLLRLRDSIQRKQTTASERTLPLAGTITRFSPWAFWVCATLLFGAVTWISSARFNYDFASLETRDLPSYELDKDVNELLGHSQTPLVLMTTNAASAKTATSALRERSEKLGDESGIDRVTSSAELVPSGQTEKAEILAALSETLQLIEPESLSKEERKQLSDLERRAKAKPFAEADLPGSVRRSFHAVDGSGDFVLVLPGISLTDGAKIRGLANEVRNVSIGDGNTQSATGEAMVLADVLDSVFRETPRSVVIALSAVFLALWLLTGRLRTAVLCLFPAVVTVAASLGLMPLVGLEFNYLNIIVLPVLLGMGVDGGAHILGRIHHLGSVEEGLRHAGHSVLGALVTTALGFVALLSASHPGLSSIAKLALVGLGVNVLATIVFLPAALALWGRASEYAKTTSGWIAEAVTVGRAGCAPVGPGTCGAVLALPLGWLMREQSPVVWTAVLVALSVASIWVVELYVRKQPSKDPQEVVLDETVGCLITLAFVPWEFFWVAAAFIAFRFFDMAKPGPVGILDRKAPGGYGVMLDDIAAGLLAGPLLYLAHLYL